MIEVSGAVINSEPRQEAEGSQRYQPPRSQVVKGPKVARGDYAQTEVNHIGAGNQYGSLIPSDMLEGESEGDTIDEFAVSWGPPSAGRVEVKVDPKEEA